MLSNHPKAKLLSSHGVGKRYHNQSLTEYPNPNAAKLIEWITSHDAAKGEGICVIGSDAASYELTVLTARALILSGHEKLFCMPMYEAMEPAHLQMLWENKPPLILTNFYVTNSEQYRTLENLLNYYLDHVIPLSVHFTMQEPEKMSENKVNPVLINRLMRTNTLFYT